MLGGSAAADRRPRRCLRLIRQRLISDMLCLCGAAPRGQERPAAPPARVLAARARASAVAGGRARRDLARRACARHARAGARPPRRARRSSRRAGPRAGSAGAAAASGVRAATGRACAGSLLGDGVAHRRLRARASARAARSRRQPCRRATAAPHLADEAPPPGGGPRACSPAAARSARERRARPPGRAGSRARGARAR